MQHEISIHRWDQDAGLRSVRDTVTLEEPMEIRVRGRAVSVTMRTPSERDDTELAIGFLLSEGLIQQRSDVARVDPCVRAADGNVMNITLSPSVEIDFDKLTRHVFASSSCGLCGKASIDAVHQHFHPIENNLKIPVKTLQKLPRAMRQVQATFDQTGGLHAAALFDAPGNLLTLREDVGRHNAVDKVLGEAFLNERLPLDQHVLLVSGRASFEIMQKALAGRIALVCAVSAPSSLAVEFAQDSGQTLIGFLREGRMNIYTHNQRVVEA